MLEILLLGAFFGHSYHSKTHLDAAVPGPSLGYFWAFRFCAGCEVSCHTVVKQGVEVKALKTLHFSTKL